MIKKYAFLPLLPFSLLLLMLLASGMVSCVTFYPPNYTAGRQSFIEGNYYEAFKQLYPVAQKGHPEAQYAIGYMYYYGLGVAQDRQAASAWLQRAANQGQEQAIVAIDVNKPQLMPIEQQYVPASIYQLPSDSAPNEANSQRKASWPPARGQ